MVDALVEAGKGSPGWSDYEYALGTEGIWPLHILTHV